MGYSKPYAKPCKFCKTVQVVWDEKLEGPNKFKEVQTNQPHTRDRCDAAKGGGQQQESLQQNREMQQQYRPQQKQEPILDFSDYEDLRLGLKAVETKVDNLAIGIAKIMSQLTNIVENAGTFKEMQELRTENQQLKETIKKEGMGIKTASKIQQEEAEKETDYDQHVRDMVEKGKQAEEEEELDLT